MADIFKSPYEISVWEDVLVTEYWPKQDIEIDDEIYSVNDRPVPENKAIEYAEEHSVSFDSIFSTVLFYDEEKVGVIGSDTMDTPIRAFEPALKRNVNGTVSLSFFIYMRYYDEEDDDIKFNPWTDLLVNERKLKLKYGKVWDEQLEHWTDEDAWYDCIIKDVQEDSNGETITITTSDMHINELSKTGFNIEFDTKLNNNIGTISELAQKVIDGTDWRLADSDIFNERQEEPLYEVTIALGYTLDVVDVMTGSIHKTILEGQKFYAFYTSILNLEDGITNEVQIIWDPTASDNYDNYTRDGLVILENLDDDRLEARLWYGNVTLYELANSGARYGVEEFIWPAIISELSRGKRLIENIKTIYDPVTNKVVTVYKYTPDRNEYQKFSGTSFESGTVYYEYSEELETFVLTTDTTPLSEKTYYIAVPVGETTAYGYYTNNYLVSTVLTNLISNGEAFPNEEDWVLVNSKNQTITGQISLSLYPPIKDPGFSTENFHNFLRIDGTNLILNTGLVSNLSDYTGFSKDDKYVFRISYGIAETGEGGIATSLPTRDPSKLVPGTGIKAIIKDYKITKDSNGNTYYKYGNVYFSFPVPSQTLNKGTNIDGNKACDFVYSTGTCITTLSYSKMLSGLRDRSDEDNSGWNIGVFLVPNDPGNGYDYYVESVLLFPYLLDTDGEILVPKEAPSSQITKTYYYYEPIQYTGVETELDIEYIYKGNEILTQFIAQKGSDISKFEKVRTIVGKESNRFNLLQSLCELFECWIKFNVVHNSTGKIELEYYHKKEDENDTSVVYNSVRLKKSISFREYIGRDNYAGFKYGINLNTILRNLASDNIVTKLIVKQNSNEHAINGFCTIARADDNPIKETFLLNVEYYIQLRMLSYGEWIADLYTTTNGHLGYYKALREWNLNNQELLLEKSSLERAVDRLYSEKVVYDLIIEEALYALGHIIELLYSYLSHTSETATTEEILAKAKDRVEKNNDEEARSLLTEYYTFKQLVDYYLPFLQLYEEEINQAIDRIDYITEEIERETEEKNRIQEQFYTKYARFILEGSWISEDYIDDDLYYLDAQNVLYTSAFPQVSYTINVLEISEVEGYENYKYDIGDKTTIEDVDFFGYDPNINLPTPYKEKVVVSETTDYLDSPDRNTITILNYKTLFEDLFQRITATTLSLQYASGEYNRASDIVETNGTISPTVILNSLVQNAITLSNARNLSTVLGDDGLTSTNLANPLEITRLISGGLYVSSDGGVNWTTGISAAGINTSLLTAGQINADDISIYSGSFPTFRWNKQGMTAYEYGYIPSYFVNYNKFVRHDQYGIYGVLDAPTETWTALNIQDIKNIAQFGLIWGEFFMKSNDHGGLIKISSTDDFLVLSQTYTAFSGSTFDDNITYYTKDNEGYYHVSYDDNPQSGVQYYYIDSSNERVKIGCLNLANDLYGIRISNNNSVVMLTGSDGNLWLLNMLTVGDPIRGSTTYIGYNTDNEKTRRTELREFHLTNDTTDPSKTYYEITSVSGDEYQSYLVKVTEETNEVFYRLAVPPYTASAYYIANALEPSEVGSSAYVMSRVTYDTGAHEVIHAGQDGVTTEQFIVYEDGYISASGGTFTGEINATSGSIGGISVDLLGNAIAGINLYNDFILMIAGNANYTFTPEALNIYNAGFNIFSTTYEEYEGTPSSDDPGTYFTKQTNPDGTIEYIKATKPYSGSTTYYTAQYLKALYTEKNDLGNEDLYMSGIIYASGGEFTGTIHAENGEFNGEVNATSGTLLNMDVTGLLNVGDSDGSHIYIDGNGGIIGSSNYVEGGNTGFLINENGSIFANDIELGLAKMKKYINLGNDTWIFNTELTRDDLAGDIAAQQAYTTNGDALVVWNTIDDKREKTIQINQEGYINVAGQGKIFVGNNDTTGIYLDSQTESIKSGSFSYLGNSGWYIDSLDAIFNDITARGSIKASVLEYGSVLAIGGIMIVRPSTRITDLAKLTYTEAESLEESGTYYRYEMLLDDYLQVSWSYILSHPTETYYTLTKELTSSADEGNAIKVENILGFKVNDWCVLGDAGIDSMISATADPDAFDLGLSRVGYQITSVVYDNELNDGSGYVKFRASATDRTINDYSNYTINDAREQLIGGGSEVHTLTYAEMIGLPLVSMVNDIDTDDENSVGLALNSSKNDHFVPATSFSVFESTLHPEKYTIEPEYKIILGKLPNTTEFAEKILPSYLSESYGLYAENAILSGSLVTINNEEGYIAGINTQSHCPWATGDAQKYFPEAYNSGKIGPIILWAGEGDRSGEEATIQNAAFKLDTFGNLFAGSAYFQGTVISDATITAAEIRSAVIRGWDISDKDVPGGSPAGLILENIEHGIEFKDGDSTKFELGRSGIKVSDLPFETNDMIVAKRIYGYEINQISSALGANRIGFVDTSIDKPILDSQFLAYLTYDSSTGSIVFNTENKEVLRLDANSSSFGTAASPIELMLVLAGATTVNSNDYYLGSGDSTLHYLKTSFGYNLFVGE